MVFDRGSQDVGTDARQHQVHAPTVARARLSGHEAVLLQPVSQAGDAPSAECDLLSELAHDQSTIGRPRDPQQDFERLEADAVTALQVGVEQAGEPLVRFEQEPERVDAIVGFTVGFTVGSAVGFVDGSHGAHGTARSLLKK